MCTRTIFFILLRAASLILSLSGGCASAIPFPNFQELKLKEQRAKKQADLVIEVEHQYFTYFFEEERTKLPSTAATYRRWSHLNVLSVERNELSRVVPSSLALEANRYLSAKLSACDAVRGNIFNINCFPLMAHE